MANNRSNERSNRNQKRDDEGRFAGSSWTETARERPYATAAVAAGVAAAGAFLWSRRGQIGDAASAGMDRLGEMKEERFAASDSRSQSEIAEEALTLKETGQTTDPLIQQQSRTGAVAY